MDPNQKQSRSALVCAFKRDPKALTEDLCAGLSFHQSGGVGILELSDWSKRNAFGREKARALLGLFARWDVRNEGQSSSQPLVLLIHSSLTGIFASGGDLQEIVEDPDVARLTMNEMRDVCTQIVRLPLLSVVLLNGRALGGGAEFALAADQRWITDPRASLELKQRDWSLPAGWNGLGRLVTLRPVGGIRRAAMDLMLGTTFRLQELVAQGLGEDATGVSVADILARASALAQSLGSCPEGLRWRYFEFLRNVKECRDEPLELAREMRKLFDAEWLSVEHRKRLDQFRRRKDSDL